MFNVMDIIVLAVIALSVFWGYKKGFIRAAISLVSFFVAIGLALMFYKPLAVILTENTIIDEWIIENITASVEENDNLLYENTELEKQEENDSGLENTNSELENIETINEENEVNDMLKEQSLLNLLEHLPATLTEKFNLEEMKNSAKEEIAYQISELIMNLLSLIVIYVVVKVTLSVAAVVLNGIMQIPVLKQLNELLGMLLGAVLGFIQMYIAFAVITFISSVCNISTVIEMIKVSSFARILFENNLIINLLF